MKDIAKLIRRTKVKVLYCEAEVYNIALRAYKAGLLRPEEDPRRACTTIEEDFNELFKQIKKL